MALKLMYITNDPKIATIAEESGVDWIFIDLEIKGKLERQGHLDTVISKHSVDDIKPIKSALKKSKLLVRINPVNNETIDEIDNVINEGADIIMLPYFKTRDEVEVFINAVDSRAETCLLLETPQAVVNVDDILDLKGIDYIHIGLNDLHLGFKMKFMFELLADGTVEKLCNKFKKHNVTYGFGGIAQIGQGTLPAERIITEHHRLNSTMVILSRTFFNQENIKDYNIALKTFSEGIQKIREFEQFLNKQQEDYLTENKQIIDKAVKSIVNQIEAK